MRKVSQVAGEHVKDVEGGIHKYTLPVTFLTSIPSMPNMEAVCSSKPPSPTYKLYGVPLYRTQQKQESATRYSGGIEDR